MPLAAWIGANFLELLRQAAASAERRSISNTQAFHACKLRSEDLEEQLEVERSRRAALLAEGLAIGEEREQIQHQIEAVHAEYPSQ